MKLLYRAMGRGGGQWKISCFIKQNSKIEYDQWKYGCLPNVRRAVINNENNIVSNLKKYFEYDEDEIEIVTNVSQENISPLVQKIKYEIGCCADLKANYKPSRNDKSQDLWVLSRYLCENGLYNLNPMKPPESPYTVYTDASYWPELDRASVGFVVKGRNRGVYSFGSPVCREIPDNNVAEFYSALSALKMIHKSDEVVIKTDSENLRRINEQKVDDPRNEVISSLSREISDFKSVSVESVERKDVEISDEIARMCKSKTLELGSEPKSAF